MSRRFGGLLSIDAARFTERIVFSVEVCVDKSYEFTFNFALPSIASAMEVPGKLTL